MGFMFRLFTTGASGAENPGNAENAAESDPVISVAAGKIRGATITAADGINVHVFTGIPFAQPPIGDLRYKKPQPVKPWGNNVRDATQMPPSCMQISVFQPRLLLWVPYHQPKSEDCLYLNIWTPTLNTSARLPVMAWLHGGSFESGSAAMRLEDGSNLAALGEVVVVTIAYRLQSFGFLYSGTQEAPGNQGLQDQVLALKWIQENILGFGGDPGEVTLFGFSAGGYSTGYHLLYPGSKDLFRRAIVQSAGVINKGRVQDKSVVLNSTREFARVLGCYKDDERGEVKDDAISCLRNLNATLIATVEQTFTDAGSGIFKPIFGDHFLPVDPRTALFPSDKDVMIGNVANEGSIMVYDAFRDTFSQVLPSRNINKAEMIHYLGTLWKGVPLPQLILIHQLYMAEITDFDYSKLRQALVDAHGDIVVVCGTFESAEKIASANTEAKSERSVHVYQMNHVSRCNRRQPWFGMTHGDDVPLIFGRAFDRQGECAEDIPFSRDIISVWSNFAKGRAPAGPDGTEWPKFTADSMSLLKITSMGSNTSIFELGTRCKVLKELGLY
ncbi:acetylcholinesterase-1-like [Amblyomma americanum]